MTKDILYKKLIRNSLFGSGIEDCKVFTYLFANTNNGMRIIKQSRHTLFKIGNEYKVENIDISKTRDTEEDSSNSNTFKVYSHDDGNNDTLNIKYKMISYVSYSLVPDGEILNYNYSTSYTTINGTEEDTIKLYSDHTIKDEDKEHIAHILYVIFPVVKTVPLIIDVKVDDEFVNGVNKTDISDDYYNDKVNNFLENIDYAMYSDNDDILFNSYLETFNTESYVVKKKGSFNDIKAMTTADRLKELSYMGKDTFDKKSDKVTSECDITHIKCEYTRDSSLNTVVYTYFDVPISKITYTDDNSYRESIREGLYEGEDFTTYSDYGYNGENSHMSKICSENELTEEELFIINQFDFDSIEYEEESARIKYIGEHIKNPNYTLIFDDNDEVKDYNKLFPYKWIDKDNTENGMRVIELFGAFPDNTGNVARTSLLIINSKVAINTVIFDSGTSKSIVSSYYYIKDNELTFDYSIQKSIETNLYASNVITEIDNDKGFKFRITERKNTNFSGNITGDFYSYESPDLNIVIDKLNKKIVDFTSAVYNKYYDDIVYVRDMYGCLQELEIKDLAK